MTVASKECEHVTVIELAGELDTEAAGEVRQRLGDCMRSGRGNVVVDLRKVNEISCVGIGILVERLRQFRARNGDIKLVRLPGWMEEAFGAVGANVFDTFSSIEDSLRSFYVSPVIIQHAAPMRKHAVAV